MQSIGFANPRRITKGFINPTKTSENHRFSEVLLYALYPQSQQNIEVSGVHKGGNRNCTCFATSKGFISLFFSDLHTTRWLKICHLGSLVRWLFYEDVVHFTLCTTNAIKKYHNNGYTS